MLGDSATQIATAKHAIVQRTVQNVYSFEASILSIGALNVKTAFSLLGRRRTYRFGYSVGIAPRIAKRREEAGKRRDASSQCFLGVGGNRSDVARDLFGFARNIVQRHGLYIHIDRRNDLRALPAQPCYDQQQYKGLADEERQFSQEISGRKCNR